MFKIIKITCIKKHNNNIDNKKGEGRRAYSRHESIDRGQKSNVKPSQNVCKSLIITTYYSAHHRRKYRLHYRKHNMWKSSFKPDGLRVFK